MPLPDLLPVFNALPGAHLLLSPEWRIVAASDEYLAATLTQRDAIVGQHIFDAFPDNPLTLEANAVANVRAALKQVQATGRPHDMPPQHYDVPDPAQPVRFVERHWLPRHTPVHDEAGQLLFILQSVQDITTSRLVQRQLRESQTREQVARADAERRRHEFRHFLEQAPVAVAVYRGPEFRVELANATTLSIWGRPLEAVLGRPVFEALPEAATPEVVAIFEHVFRTGTPHTAVEQPTTIYRHGRPEVVYWNVVFEAQRDADGRITGLFTVGIEVTVQVRARQQVELLNQGLEARVQQRTEQLAAVNVALQRTNEELHETNQQLTRTNQDLDNFVYAASHDLKQPVTNLGGLFDELQRSIRFTDPAEERLLVPLIQQALQQLLRNIDDLAALGQAQLVGDTTPEPLALATLTEEVLQVLAPQVRAARARITTDFGARPDLSYSRLHLRTVLLNLLSNALKYADPQRLVCIHVSVRVADGQPVLVVQDNGQGFDAQKYGHQLFQLFRRLHPHTTGAGVGLYLVHRIVQAHGGRIEVDSQEGGGATFRVYLGRR